MSGGGGGAKCPTVWSGQEGLTQSMAKGSTRGCGATSRKWPRESWETQAWEDTENRTQGHWGCGPESAGDNDMHTQCPGSGLRPMADC